MLPTVPNSPAPAKTGPSLTFDANELSNVCTNEPLRQKFVSWAKKRDASCYLPTLALMELFEDVKTNPRGAGERLAGLKNLVKLMPTGSIFDGIEFGAAVEDEVKGRAPVLHKPVDKSLLAWLLTVDPTMLIAAGLHGGAEYLRGLKDDLHRDELALRDHGIQGSQAPSADELLNAFSGTGWSQGDEYFLQVARAKFVATMTQADLQSQAATKWTATQATRALIARTRMANLSATHVRGPLGEEIGRFRTKQRSGRGDLCDAYTAGLAALTDFFVADDSDLLYRVTYVTKKGVKMARMLRLSELLSEPVAGRQRPNTATSRGN